MSETLTNGVIVPDKGSRDWYADLRSNWLKLDSLMAGGNITVNPAQTDGILVATITVGGKEYKLYQQDGDVSVKIDPSAENAEYPLVASTSAEANTGSVVMAPAVTVNPSTGALTATSFKGKLDGNASTATTATKAVQDGAGAVITDTYATKSELGSKADDANVVHKSGTETIVGTKTFTNQMYLGTGGTGYGQISACDTNGILRLYGGTKPANGANLDLNGENLNDGCFAIRARTTDKIVSLEGKTNGVLTWNGKVIAINDNVVHNTGNETIAGVKTFKNTMIGDVGGAPVLKVANGSEIYLFKKDHATMPGGIILRSFKADGTYIDFKIINNGSITWGNANILTDNNQIMVLKNLTGNKITSGAVIDCGTGNGMLVGWFMNTAGTWTLANNKPTGKWKNANNFSLLAEESGMFVKVG